MYSSNCHIFIVTETWLTEQVLDNEILPSGYCIFRKDRTLRGGGVLVAIDSAISVSQSYSYADNTRVNCS